MKKVGRWFSVHLFPPIVLIIMIGFGFAKTGPLTPHTMMNCLMGSSPLLDSDKLTGRLPLGGSSTRPTGSSKQKQGSQPTHPVLRFGYQGGQAPKGRHGRRFAAVWPQSAPGTILEGFMLSGIALLSRRKNALIFRAMYDFHATGKDE